MASGGNASPAGAPDERRRDPRGGTGYKPAGKPDEDEPLQEEQKKRQIFVKLLSNVGVRIYIY